MGLFDTLLGRSRPVPSKTDSLFAMSTAVVSLETRLGLKPGTRAGICFRAVESNYFDKASSELDGLLQITARETGLRYETEIDKFGYRWIVVDDDEFGNLVATIHVVSQTLVGNGFGDQLLAAVFRFTTPSGQPVYWLYNYKRGKFYPFVPEGDTRKRDNPVELRLASAMERELPMEPELERWYALWSIPI
jgi:hypothetical protein